MIIYLIGSLRNPKIPTIGNTIRDWGHEVFDDWFAAGPEADDHWRLYEEERGKSYVEALSCHAAQHVFGFDLHHINRAEAGVLVMPAGKSGHLELGYLAGQRKPTYIVLDDPDRWDVMYNFATGVCVDMDDLRHKMCAPNF